MEQSLNLNIHRENRVYGINERDSLFSVGKLMESMEVFHSVAKSVAGKVRLNTDWNPGSCKPCVCLSL